MPFIKVPDSDLEIWIDLDEAVDPKIPLIVDLGELGQLTPEQFAAEMKDPFSDWIFLPPMLVLTPKDAHIEIEISARRFQKHRVRKGRPFAHTFSRAEDFALVVLYFESLGYKQSTKKARDYWVKHGQHCPTARQIEEALKIVRGWQVIDLKRTIQIIKKQYRLKEVVHRKK